MDSMNVEALQSVTPSIADAIDPNILTVAPKTSIAEVIGAMSGSNHASGGHRSSCALVVEQGCPIGIFTERDIVRLTATSADIVQMPVGRVMTSPVKTLQQSALQDIFAVLFLFRRYRIRHLPIVDDANELIGIVTPASIRQVLRPANLLKLRRVADVMSRTVQHAQRTTPVLTLAKEMALNRVSCIVIADVETEADLQSIQPVGIVTERDIVQLRALKLDLGPLVAQDVMSTPLFLLSPEDSLWDAHQEMQRRHVRRLVVSWNWGKGLGIVTQTSLLKIFDPIEMYGIMETMQKTIHQLQQGAAVPERAGSLPRRGHDEPVLGDLLLDMEATLLKLAVNTHSEQQRQTMVSTALETLQRMREQLRT
ncbi:MAG: CBS domain-containing protein [Cyanobacteria bacterium J06626_23]